MKLTTIRQAMNQGIFRDGDLVNLTKIIHPYRERFLGLSKDDTGVIKTQIVVSQNLRWFYSCNSTTKEPVLIGLPTKDCQVALEGKTGFINGTIVLDKTVNLLYGNNLIGVYGRQITEMDFYGLTRKELDECTTFERMLCEVKDIETVFTGTPYIKTSLKVRDINKLINYGYKKITFTPLILSEASEGECLYSSNLLLRKGAQNYFEKQRRVTTPLFPILYGEIDELLVDISNSSQKENGWKLYPPKKSEEC